MSELPPLFELFSSRLQAAIANACEVSLKTEAKSLDSRHILYGLLTERGSVSADVLTRAGLNKDAFGFQLPSEQEEDIDPNDLQSILAALESQPNQEAIQEQLATMTEEAKEVLLKSMILSESHGHPFVGTEHVLAAVIETKESAGLKLLNEAQISEPFLREQLEDVLEGGKAFTEIANMYKDAGADNSTPHDQMGMAPTAAPAGSANLMEFCLDLTSPEQVAKTDPLVGRDEELERMVNILSRRSKNNPMIIGEPGTGKTALVRGLASRIAEDKVPEVLKGKRILELDLAKVIAGTMFRGEFEGRLKQLLDEVAADENIVLFIDEIHTIMGLGNASGSMDMASVLKPVITSSDIQLVGATTFAEYKKHIEKDPAMERRFQPIKVEEPAEADAVQILKGLKKKYEEFHQLCIPDDAIEAAVRLSSRYVQDRFLPDKAIDVIDEAASQIKIMELERGVSKLVQSIEAKAETLKERKRRAVEAGDYDKALVLKEKERIMLEELNRLRSGGDKKDRKQWSSLSVEHIAKVVSKSTGIPVDNMIDAEKKKLAKLEETLKEHVIGQDEAVEAVSKVVKRARAGISSPNRPLGSFLFLGPTGVGKTELAKVLAREVFGNEKAMIRVDMSEFGEKFNVSKMIGSPAGYVGFEEGGNLTEQVRRKPYSVILFDEIEKAHPDIFNILLQVLDDGHLTDAAGKKVSFKNTIIIMTSNNGVTAVANNKSLGFGEEEATEGVADMQYENYKAGVLAELRKTFKPEFINRIDRTLVFRPLSEKAIHRIIDLQLDELNTRLEEQGLKLAVGKAARAELAREGFDPEYGARPLRRVIQERIEDQLADLLIEGKVAAGSVINVMKRKAGLVLQPKQSSGSGVGAAAGASAA
ncbi:MAG: ATP-dependent Clp protease ATP-binding subunit [Candidatus Andersenbacteria bacterium]|nr:ATP-dependent Clp protease ATP-binding subunit [Candidatus Andersenbacteria bacterium]